MRIAISVSALLAAGLSGLLLVMSMLTRDWISITNDTSSPLFTAEARFVYRADLVGVLGIEILANGTKGSCSVSLLNDDIYPTDCLEMFSTVGVSPVPYHYMFNISKYATCKLLNSYISEIEQDEKMHMVPAYSRFFSFIELAVCKLGTTTLIIITTSVALLIVACVMLLAILVFNQGGCLTCCIPDMHPLARQAYVAAATLLLSFVFSAAALINYGVQIGNYSPTSEISPTKTEMRSASLGYSFALLCVGCGFQVIAAILSALSAVRTVRESAAEMFPIMSKEQRSYAST